MSVKGLNKKLEDLTIVEHVSNPWIHENSEENDFTIREVADDVDIPFGLCQAIFTDVLGMKNFKILSKNNVSTFNDNPDLLKYFITGDESWVYGYDNETKAESFQWKRPEKPRPKKTLQVQSNVKVLLPVFFDGVLYHELLSQGRVVNKECYQEVTRVVFYISGFDNPSVAICQLTALS